MHHKAQTEISALMTELGYEDVEAGVCHGTSIMAAQAHLGSDGIDAINHLKRTIEEDPALARKIITTKERLDKRRGRLRSSKKWVITSEEKKLIEHHVFFKGIMAYQEPFRLIQQGPNWCTDLITQHLRSHEDHHIFHDIKQIGRWTSVYTTQERINYFSLLNQMAQINQIDFSIILHSHDHAISYHYKSSENKWYMCDANELPIQPCTKVSKAILRLFNISSDHAIAVRMEQFAQEAFKDTLNDKYIIQSMLMVNNRDFHAGVNLLKNLEKSQAFIALQELTPEKINYRLNNGWDLAFFAVMYNQPECLRKLYLAGADLTLTYTENMSLQEWAEIYNTDEVIKILERLKRRSTATYR